MPHTKTIAHYHQNADRYQAQYDSVAAEDVHASWAHLLAQRTPGRALDVGAGSGRDAAWLAQQGWQVTAVEPAQALRERGRRATGPGVHWLDAQLPDLHSLPTSSGPFDLILLSAVWMHLSADQRPQALRCLCERLSAKGMLMVTLRFGPSDPERPMYPVSATELSQLAKMHGCIAQDLEEQNGEDQLQRPDVYWQTVCVRPKESGQ